MHPTRPTETFGTAPRMDDHLDKSRSTDTLRTNEQHDSVICPSSSPMSAQSSRAQSQPRLPASAPCHESVRQPMYRIGKPRLPVKHRCAYAQIAQEASFSDISATTWCCETSPCVSLSALLSNKKSPNSLHCLVTNDNFPSTHGIPPAVSSSCQMSSLSLCKV